MNFFYLLTNPPKIRLFHFVLIGPWDRLGNQSILRIRLSSRFLSSLMDEKRRSVQSPRTSTKPWWPYVLSLSDRPIVSWFWFMWHTRDFIPWRLIFFVVHQILVEKTTVEEMIIVRNTMVTNSKWLGGRTNWLRYVYPDPILCLIESRWRHNTRRRLK